MKILWLCSWFPNDLDAFGGDFIERHAKSLSIHHPVDVIHLVQDQSLSKTGHAGIYTHHEHGLRVMVHVIQGIHTGFSFLNKTLYNLHYFFSLRRILDDYINTYGKPDVVHVHVPLKIGAGALYLFRKYHIPFVVTEHNSAYFPHIPGYYQTLNLYYRWITRQSFRKALAVSSVSDWLTNRIQFLFNPKQLKVIRNSVDTGLFYHIPSQNSKKRFIHVSMMEPLKNVAGIIKAFILLNASYVDWELVLVGPANEEINELIKNGHIEDKVFMTGLIPYREVAEQMRQADVLVHFSRYENLPCVISEALCCGLTVISSDVGGVNELIDQKNGILVKSEDIHALKHAILNYIMNINLYNRENISKEATSKFNYHTIGLELLKWYQELLKQ